MNENQSPKPNGFFAGIRKANMFRTDDRWVGGVSGAVAQRTRLDQTLIRGLFVIAGLFGVGFLAYGIAWLLLPDVRDGKIAAEEITSGNIDGPFIGAIAFIVIGLWTPFGLGSLTIGTWALIPNGIGLIIIAAVVLVALASNSSSSGGSGGSSGSGGSGGSGAHGQSGAPGQASEHPVSPPVAAQPPRASGMEGPATHAETATPDAPTMPLAPQYGAPHFGAPHYKEPKPKREHHRAGTALVAAVVGLALITAAIVSAGTMGPTNWWVGAAGAAVIVLGLGIVLAGFLGRTSSVLSPLALVTVLLTMTASLGWIGSGKLVGEENWRPTTAAHISGVRSVGVGDIRADLTAVPLDYGAKEIEIKFGVGEAEVIVPNDRRVVVETWLSVGDIAADLDNNPDQSGLLLSPSAFVFGDNFPEENTMHVSVAGLVGNINIVTANATTGEVTS